MGVEPGTMIRAFILPIATLLSALSILSSNRAFAQDERPVRMYVLAGQSNMNGKGYASDLPPHLNGPQYDVLFHQGHWMSLQPLSGHFGPEITFGRTMADRMTSDTIALVKLGVDTTSLAYHWRARSGPLYWQLLQRVQIARDTLGLPTKICGMLWMQGEGDAVNASDSAAYEQHMREFIAAVREDFGAPDMAFVIGRINAPGFRYRSNVRIGQMNVAVTEEDVFTFNTDDLPLWGDNLHYSSYGQRLLGERYAEYLVFGASGWFFSYAGENPRIDYIGSDGTLLHQTRPNAEGFYIYSGLPYEWSGRIVPSLEDYRFEPVDYEIETTTGSFSDLDFQTIYNRYHISGWTETAGATVTLTRDGQTYAATTTTAEGFYLFDHVPAEWQGEVIPWRPDTLFEPTRRPVGPVVSDTDSVNFVVITRLQQLLGFIVGREPIPARTYEEGDVNGNGWVEVGDAIELLRLIQEAAPPGAP